MIGLELDFNMNPDITRQLLELERCLRFLPRSIGGDDHEDVLRLIPTTLTGDANAFTYADTDPSEVRAAAQAGGGNMYGGMGGMAMPAPVAAAAGGGKSAEVMAAGKEYTTKKGKNKDQYGRKAGKKQKAAMLEFTKTLWLQDATNSLKNLLQMEIAQQAFMQFLKTEYGEAQLEFFLEAQRLDALPPEHQEAAALQIYQMFLVLPQDE